MLWEFNFWGKFVCIDKNNDRNKTKFPVPSVTVFLIAEELLNL